MYLKWTCPKCKDVVISNSFRHHQMDFCKCNETGVDLEEYGCRFSSNYPFDLQESLVEYDYNFFDEIAICMEKQGYEVYLKIGDRLYIEYSKVMEIRKIEDEILGGLK